MPAAPTPEGLPVDLQRPLVPIERLGKLAADLLDQREALDTARRGPVWPFRGAVRNDGPSFRPTCRLMQHSALNLPILDQLKMPLCLMG